MDLLSAPDQKPSPTFADRLSALQQSFMDAARRFRAWLYSEKGKRLFWQGKVAPAFWTTASVLSLIVNIILIVILLAVVHDLFTIKSIVQKPLIGGLYDNFVKMDDASIKTTIQVKDTIQVSDTLKVQDTIPVVFDLPLKENTSVVLTQDTPISNAIIYLNGAAVPLNIVLPRGTPLNIQLDLTVPVNQMLPVTLNVPINLKVPVNLSVPVDIPLNQTDLHEPFTGLQRVIGPYDTMLADLPDNYQQLPVCGPLTSWVCGILFR